MNCVYLYNDSFVSLLNLIDILISKNIRPGNIKNIEYSPNLFEKNVKLELDDNDEILDRIIKEINYKNFKIMYYVFLSENDNKELIIFYFYLNALKYKHKVIYMRNLKCVCEALRISQYVSRENHKYKGFVRFKELENNIYYAEIEPVNNVLEILSNHFKKRLKNEYWIIKDVKRNIVSLYDKKDFIIVDADKFQLHNDNTTENERFFKELWLDFYKVIGIEPRKNDRCRMNFMPKRYWKYITEMDGFDEKDN